VAAAPPSDARDVATLCKCVARGARPKFVFFWSHRAPRQGGVAASCLSQWYPAPFTLAGDRYPTAEHFMMAEKARIFGDEKAAGRILAAKAPGHAKRLGREVRGFDEAVWVERRFEVAVTGNLAKFGGNPALCEFLLGTSRRVLVEASPTDRIWGIGLEANDPAAANPSRWRGENLLGFALMEARARLAASGGSP
jgi:hypothetical protein